jgi:hypothetical protein
MFPTPKGSTTTINMGGGEQKQLESGDDGEGDIGNMDDLLKRLQGTIVPKQLPENIQDSESEEV